jgi:uncharacterized protein (TIGR02145 family)
MSFSTSTLRNWAVMSVLAMFVLLGCGGDDNPAGGGGGSSSDAGISWTSTANLGEFTDARNGQKYYAARIGQQIWMAENLNYNVAGSSWCYEESAANCRDYGRLYTWNAAKTACPSGWHLPTADEWNVMINFTGGQGNKLRMQTGWGDPSSTQTGTNDYWFSALPGGLRISAGDYRNLHSSGIWWTNSVTSATGFPLRVGVSNNNQRMSVSELGDFDANDVNNLGYSVRCVHN